MTLPRTPSFRLEGRRALVAGASSGIGAAAAVALGEQGAEVWLVARRAPELQALVAEMRASGFNAHALPLDIIDIAATEAALNALDPFDILVNSAGGARHSPAVETTPADFDFAVNLNFRAAYFLTRTVANLPDYIQGVTFEIWEGRDISSLYRAYGPAMVARSTLGVMVGAEEGIRDTLASQAAFPDRQILGDEVIWSGNEAEGYLSSHRSMIIGTHTGHGVFGPPTGKVVAARCIADCHVKDDVIDDEWPCYDMADMVRQLGHTPESWARAPIAVRTRRAAPSPPPSTGPAPIRDAATTTPWARAWPASSSVRCRIRPVRIERGGPAPRILPVGPGLDLETDPACPSRSRLPHLKERP